VIIIKIKKTNNFTPPFFYEGGIVNLDLIKIKHSLTLNPSPACAGEGNWQNPSPETEFWEKVAESRMREFTTAPPVKN